MRRNRGHRLRCVAEGAFTLIEVLVASALGVVIAGILLGLSEAANTHWQRTAGALASESEARAALDCLEQDLQGAWSLEDGAVWLRAAIQADASASGVWMAGGKPAAGSLNPEAADLRDARFGLAGTWLRFFTVRRMGGTEAGPAPVAVSYQIVRRAPTPAASEPHYLLYRSEVRPAATLDVGYDLRAPAYSTASDMDGDAGTMVRPLWAQALGDNVIDIGFRFFAYRPDPDSGLAGWRLIFPVAGGAVEYQAQSPASPSEPTHAFPAVVEILIRVLTPEGVRQLEALESGRLAGDWWDIAGRNSRVFVRRVQVAARWP